MAGWFNPGGHPDRMKGDVLVDPISGYTGPGWVNPALVI
jgi:hypothetical protein